MQSARLNELKKELDSLPAEELVNLCLKLARFKKENKELLHYLLLEQQDEAGYIRAVIEALGPEFLAINNHNLYLAKKSIRRNLKLLNKYINYSGKKETEIALLLFFCKKVKEMELPIQNNQVLLNLYNRQVQKINKAMGALHEDLQYDYAKQIEDLEIES